MVLIVYILLIGHKAKCDKKIIAEAAHARLMGRGLCAVCFYDFRSVYFENI